MRNALLSCGVLLFASTAIAQRPPALVRVVPVVEKPLQNGQSFLGTAQPLRRSIVGSAVDGRVETFPVNEGDFVTAGQTLVQLKTDTLSLEKDEADATIEAMAAELEELKTDTLQELNSQVTLSDAEVARTEALHGLAAKQLARIESLYERGSTSLDDYESAVVAETSSKNAHLAAQAQERIAQVNLNRHEQTVKAAEARLRAAQAKSDHIQSRLNKHTLIAPFDGYVISESTEKGNWISAGAPAVEVVEVDPIKIVINVPEAYIDQIQIGEPATVRFDALNDIITASVSTVVPQADLRTRSFPVHVNMPNPKKDGIYQIKPGMLSKVTLALGDSQPGLVVPKDALVLGLKSGDAVYVVNKTDKGEVAKLVPVVVGMASGSEVEVRGQLQPGDMVIIAGNERLAPGSPVRSQ